LKLGKVAQSAGWGVARCADAKRLARTFPGTCDPSALLSSPDPAAFSRHLPRFVEKGPAAPRFLLGHIGGIDACASALVAAAAMIEAGKFERAREDR